jgi:hypothetical protein
MNGERAAARPIRTMGRGLLAGGALCVIAGVVLASGVVAAPNWDPSDNAYLHAQHKGSSNPGFAASGTCPTPPEGASGDWGWHFVLQGSSTTFVTIDVDFQNDGFHQHVPFVAQPDAKHAYVYTAGPDTLLDARAFVSGPATEFVLSGICTGTTSTTTTTTTEESTTTTEESTTTTTTEESTTTTTTTEQPTTTTTGGGLPSSTTTTAPTGSVLPSSTEPPTTAQPAASVLGEQVTRDQTIPRTGIDSDALFPIGLALLLAGLVFIAHAQVQAKAAEER